MNLLTKQEIEALLNGATQGPWTADGNPQNRIVWSPGGNRVCFMAHSSGLNDERDIAVSNLVAAAPDLARTALALMAERDDAKAAQALVVERAASVMDDICRGVDVNGGDWPGAIRALSDPSGVEALAKLREERDALETAREMLGGFWAEAIADRDRLAAANAALEAKVARLVGALADMVEAHEEWGRKDGAVFLRPLEEQSSFIQRARATLAEVQARDKGEGGE